MLEQICAFIHNFFYGDRYAGTFTIENGVLTVDGLVDGQYFRICGSRFNDGVYRYGVDQLTDETFTGVIWEMRPPRAFLDIVAEIEAWNAQYGDTVNSPYQSESVLGVYNYQLKTGGVSMGENLATWQSIFGQRLKQWRKLA